MAVIKYHVVDSLATDFSYARVNDYYEFIGLPTAKFDGILTHIGGDAYNSIYEDYLPYVDQRTTVLSDFIIDTELEMLSGNQYRLTAIIENSGGYSGADIVAQVAVTESNLDIQWGLSDKVNSVLRLMVPDENGTPLDFSGGSTQTVELIINLQDYWVEDNCKLIVFIQDNSTKEVLQTTQLDFQIDELQAGFSSDIQAGCMGLTVSFADQSIGPVTEWNWVFEGGQPETSDEQNPVVYYADAGNYDVSLTVSNGTSSDTYDFENYITVFGLPDVTLDEIENQCLNWPAWELTQGNPQGGEYSGPGVENGWFDPDQAGPGTHLITYTYMDENGCENSAEVEVIVDVCTGLTNTNPGIDFSVYPNPATNRLTLGFYLEQDSEVSIHIYNSLGVLVKKQFSDKPFAAGLNQVHADISDLNKGVYFINFYDGKNRVTKLLTVLK